MELQRCIGEGCTPLFIASSQGHVEVVRALLEAAGVDEHEATPVLAGATPVVSPDSVTSSARAASPNPRAAEAYVSANASSDFVAALCANSRLVSSLSSRQAHTTSSSASFGNAREVHAVSRRTASATAAAYPGTHAANRVVPVSCRSLSLIHI